LAREFTPQPVSDESRFYILLSGDFKGKLWKSLPWGIPLTTVFYRNTIIFEEVSARK
jgi:hypothetical protein